jgi:hypothetical protein
MSRKLGGRGRLMRPAVSFAEMNGFTVGFTQAGHLAFSGYGATVFAAGTPRSNRAAAAAISKMRAVLRGSSRPHTTSAA